MGSQVSISSYRPVPLTLLLLMPCPPPTKEGNGWNRVRREPGGEPLPRKQPGTQEDIRPGPCPHPHPRISHFLGSVSPLSWCPLPLPSCSSPLQGPLGAARHTVGETSRIIRHLLLCQGLSPVSSRPMVLRARKLRPKRLSDLPNSTPAVRFLRTETEVGASLPDATHSFQSAFSPYRPSESGATWLLLLAFPTHPFLLPTPLQVAPDPNTRGTQ